MSDQLEMGGGFSPIKMGIVAGLFAVTGAVAFSFMGNSAPKPGQPAATDVAAAPDASAATADSSAATTDASGTSNSSFNTAATTSAASAPTAQQPQAMTATAAPAAQQPAAMTAAAPASKAMPSTSAAAAPAPQQAASNTNASPAPATSANSKDSTTASAKADAGKPASANTMTAMADDSSPKAANADDTAAAPKKMSVPAKNKEPVAAPAPAASAVLHQWWKTSDAAPFGVQFVGQAAESNSLVILFSKPIDPNAVGDKVRVLSADGTAMDLNWQRGNSPQVLVQNDLPPGRYTVMLDPATASMAGQNLGTSLHGPVYIQ